MNIVILCGHLGKDVELRYTQAGTPVATFSLATPAKRKEGDAWVDATEWHTVVTWNKTAEVAGKYLTKGSRVGVQGELRTRKWQDKDGNNRYSTEVIAHSLEFMGGRPTSAEGQQPKQPAAEGSLPAKVAAPAGGALGPVDLEDIPF